VTTDRLGLTVYLGERDRLGGRLTCDVLLDLCEQHEVGTAILLRGVEGFGIKHQLHTQRILTLSEDLPLVATAVDEAGRIEGLAEEVRAVVTSGLVTLERIGAAVPADAVPASSAGGGDAAKLTLYLGRRERVDGRSAAAWAVDVLRGHGVAGATVLLGVDGMTRGARRRARFLSTNQDVPLMVTSVGEGRAVAAARAELAERLDQPLTTLERARVCKRDGVRLAAPVELAATDADGLALWQKLTVYAGEQARHGRHPLYTDLIHRLRLAGAAGATAVRGIWGYSGDHAPHGDRLLALRRRVPVVLTVIDEPQAAGRWWRIIDELTDETGLVTSEVVPAVRAVAAGVARGGLRLARVER
jgi:PII-like signaling protein